MYIDVLVLLLRLCRVKYGIERPQQIESIVGHINLLDQIEFANKLIEPQLLLLTHHSDLIRVVSSKEYGHFGDAFVLGNDGITRLQVQTIPGI